ncbi:hypothetical protein EVAR_57293_1 [Eumeta japonica]|uniref:Uncharacterized protein n=1 Tax=Eumeta variegata TaxID=151549 RepID=A0A4C1YKW8_EUMVA|nr:hypothetical protein EVAR_57293_1 [Eumeta japonica]
MLYQQFSRLVSHGAARLDIGAFRLCAALFHPIKRRRPFLSPTGTASRSNSAWRYGRAPEASPHASLPITSDSVCGRSCGTSTDNYLPPKRTQQNLARLRTTFDDEAPCKTTIYDSFVEFKRGRVNLSEEFRDGGPSTAVNTKNIDAVRPMIETDREQNLEPEPGTKFKTRRGGRIECGIGITIESLIGIEIENMKELFALGLVQLRTLIGSAIRIESGTGSRIEDGNQITIESGTEIETGLELKTGVGSESELKV